MSTSLRQLSLPSLASYDQSLPWQRKASFLRSFPMPYQWQEATVLLRRDADLHMYHDPDRITLGLPPPLRLYAGVSDPAWNRWPTLAGPYVCVSPIYGRGKSKSESVVALNPDVSVLLDSGAFSDGQDDIAGQRIASLSRSRLSFEEALDRQYRHMHKHGYADQIEALASYDVFIGEHRLGSDNGNARWSETETACAVEETINAAAFLDAHRNEFACVMTAQGKTPEQYLSCAERILPYVRGSDIIGLGGWQGIGQAPKRLLPVFRATMCLLLPVLGRASIQRVHLWGVCHAQALGELLWLADRENIQVSTDSARPALRPSFAEWGYAEWRDYTYRKKLPPIHLPQALQREAILDFDEADDPIMAMHYRLTHDDEAVRESELPDYMAWILDDELVARYWQEVLASTHSDISQVYDQVLAHDGSWVDVIRARGAHQIEHVYQVRSWLAHLHRTHWYQAPPENQEIVPTEGTPARALPRSKHTENGFSHSEQRKEGIQ